MVGELPLEEARDKESCGFHLGMSLEINTILIQPRFTALHYQTSPTFTHFGIHKLSSSLRRGSRRPPYGGYPGLPGYGYGYGYGDGGGYGYKYPPRLFFREKFRGHIGM